MKEIMHPEKFALVTGASSGLGKAFAFDLARRGIPLILVSLPAEGLPVLSEEIKNKFQIDVHHYETDLSILQNVQDLCDWVKRNFDVFLLINNAGIGGSKAFKDASLQYIQKIIQINITATTVLTKEFLPHLMMQEKSYVLNVSSMAAFSAIGYKTVYPASKSFIYSFSRGLNAELKNSNVQVSVVHPGPMRTNPEITKRIEKQGFLAKLCSMDPADIATKSLDAMFNSKEVIVFNIFSHFLMRLIPQKIFIPMITNSVRKELSV